MLFLTLQHQGVLLGSKNGPKFKAAVNIPQEYDSSDNSANHFSEFSFCKRRTLVYPGNQKGNFGPDLS